MLAFKSIFDNYSILELFETASSLCTLINLYCPTFLVSIELSFDFLQPLQA